MGQGFSHALLQLVTYSGPPDSSTSLGVKGVSIASHLAFLRIMSKGASGDEREEECQRDS
jgi:hypothetical protein